MATQAVLGRRAGDRRNDAVS